MKNLAVGIAGILFGFGLTLSGMLNPSKVQYMQQDVVITLVKINFLMTSITVEESKKSF